MDNIIENIEQWAIDRRLDEADPKAQLCKLMEEVGELAEGIVKGKHDQVIDSIGDAFVVLTILSMQVEESIEECIRLAYSEIKDRTGKMVNGTFVKTEDLKGEIVYDAATPCDCPSIADHCCNCGGVCCGKEGRGGRS